MYLSFREQQLLKGIDKAVCRSDPQLASMLAIFDRLGVGEAMPDREELRRPPGRVKAVLRAAASPAVMVVSSAVALFSRVAALCARARPARAARDSGGYPTREVS
jgi:hypothetical protein